MGASYSLHPSDLNHPSDAVGALLGGIIILRHSAMVLPQRLCGFIGLAGYAGTSSDLQGQRDEAPLAGGAGGVECVIGLDEGNQSATR